MVVHPTRTPEDSPVIAALAQAIHSVLGRRAELIASPGTYDHKHVARIGGIPHCVAYGPGQLELAHQPDEYCRIDDLVNATKVLALATLDLMGAGDRLNYDDDRSAEAFALRLPRPDAERHGLFRRLGGLGMSCAGPAPASAPALPRVHLRPHLDRTVAADRSRRAVDAHEEALVR